VYFNVTADAGHRITGYFVPDNFSGKSVIRVQCDESEPILFEANEVIPSLVAAGRHATGQCGFSLDDSVIANLADVRHLEIHEPETGLRIYRRRASDSVVKAKIFRLETHLKPLVRLDDAFDQTFQFFYKGIEQLGQETAAQILLLDHADSTYASGRLLIKPYEYFLDNGQFKTICVLRDPFLELAERIIVLKQFGSGESRALDARDSMMFEAAIEFAATLDFSDERQLRTAFRNMSAADAAIFSDPLVRSLTARTPDETIQDSSIASALQVLSGFAVVGLREHPDLFLESLAALLDTDPASLPPLPESGPVIELGDILREIRSVRSIIERDIELYHQVRTALEKAM
jgi:hypothetical protein